MRAKSYPWQQVASTLNMDARSIDLVDLGAAPMPVNDAAVVQDHIEKTIQVTPKEWNISVWISDSAIKDDQTGQLETKVRAAGDNFQKHINKRVFQVLNAGDGTTYGSAYDGQDFFDSDHVDKGASYTTNQDNEGALALSLDNFNTSWIAARKFRDDQGEFTDYDYDLVVVPPDLWSVAMNITGNMQAMDTANREENPFSGLLKPPISSPELDTTAWFLIASSEQHKPLIVAMREQPHLQHAWFDPQQPDGGRHYFKFFARYEVFYGDWRLAYQGNT
jgi:phage major head subunit gpT-like protein